MRVVRGGGRRRADLYGSLEDELFEEVRRGEVTIGGCVKRKTPRRRSVATVPAAPVDALRTPRVVDVASTWRRAVTTPFEVSGPASWRRGRRYIASQLLETSSQRHSATDTDFVVGSISTTLNDPRHLDPW